MAEYGGLQATDEGGVKYVLQDWQGSTRAVVENTGNIQSRSDDMAFGEQIGSGTGLRTAEQGFGKPDAPEIWSYSTRRRHWRGPQSSEGKTALMGAYDYPATLNGLLSTRPNIHLKDQGDRQYSTP